MWSFLQSTYGVEEAFRIFGPYRGAEIIPKVLDQHCVEVTMPLVPTNTNYVGTHFGGSLYSMCDPFFMFLLIWNLGENYMVWDKGAKVDFVKPGRGTVKAIFRIEPQEVETIREILQKEKKTIRFYETEVREEDGTVVAKIQKELYVRKLKVTS